MKAIQVTKLLFACSLGASVPVFGSSVYTPITNFTMFGNAQSQLQSQLPTGSFTASDSFATPFTIGTGNNYGLATSGSPITTTVDLSNVSNVFTMINGFAPQQGATIGTITFSYADGTSTSVNLVAGVNVRDYYQGAYANSTTSPSVENVFTYANTVGGAGTGNSSDGAYGTYVFDEQDFTLTDTSQLDSITITSLNSNVNSGGGGSGTPLLLALTVENTPNTSAAPEPGSILLLGIGAAGLALVGRRFRRC